MSSNFWLAVFLLSSTTIGAGVFGIPYATVRVGYLVGIVGLLSISVLTLAINLIYGWIIVHLVDTELHQFVGHTVLVLGVNWKRFVIVLMIVGLWGTTLAYIIGIGSFLTVVLDLAGWEYLLSVLTFVFVSMAIWFKVKLMASIEGWLTFGMVAVVVLIVLSGYTKVGVSNLLMVSDFSLANQIGFYGIVLTALSGFSIIPVMSELFHSSSGFDWGELRKAIFVGTLIPVVVYLFFQFVVVGISGVHTSEESIQGLIPFLDNGIIKMGAVFGLMAMVSSYLALSYVLKDMFQKDLELSHMRSWGFAVFPPFILFTSGLNSFITVLGVTGVLFGTVSMVLILLMYLNLRSKGRVVK